MELDPGHLGNGLIDPRHAFDGTIGSQREWTVEAGWSGRLIGKTCHGHEDGQEKKEQHGAGDVLENRMQCSKVAIHLDAS